MFLYNTFHQARLLDLKKTVEKLYTDDEKSRQFLTQFKSIGKDIEKETSTRYYSMLDKIGSSRQRKREHQLDMSSEQRQKILQQQQYSDRLFRGSHEKKQNQDSSENQSLVIQEKVNQL